MTSTIGSMHKLRSNHNAPQARIYDVQNNHIYYELIDSTGRDIGSARLHKADFWLKFEVEDSNES